MTSSTPQKRTKSESSDQELANLNPSTPDQKSSKRAKPSPSPGRVEKNPWTPAQEEALLKAVFDLALTQIPHLHEASGLKGIRTNPSINTKLRSLKKRMTGSD